MLVSFLWLPRIHLNVVHKVLEKMKVLIVCPDLNSRGGLVKVAERQFTLQCDVMEVEFYHTTTKSNCLSGQLSQLLKFPLYLMKKDFSVIHIHTASGRSFYRKLFYIFSGLLTSSLCVVHIHGGEFQRFLSTSITSRLALALCATSSKMKIITLTNKLSTYLNQNIKLKTASVVIKNPGRTKGFDVAKNSGVGGLVFVGRLCADKGIENLVRAIFALKKIGCIYSLDIYGDGDLKIQLHALIDELDLSSNVNMKGWVDDSSLNYSHYDFNVLPSDIEAMPLTVIEAMQQGIPSIVTNVGAIDEMLTHGEDSIILSDNSVNGIVDGILLSSEFDYSKLKANALENFNRNHSGESFLKSCGSLYAGG